MGVVKCQTAKIVSTLSIHLKMESFLREEKPLWITKEQKPWQIISRH